MTAFLTAIVIACLVMGLWLAVFGATVWLWVCASNQADPWIGIALTGVALAWTSGLVLAVIAAISKRPLTRPGVSD